MTLCGDRGDADRDRPGLHWCYLAADPPPSPLFMWDALDQ